MSDALIALGRMQTLWAPRASQIARSEIAKFIASVGGSVVDYKSFHAWSASDLEGFWGSLWDYARITGIRGTETVRRDPSGDPGLTVFFPQAKINVAENILRGPVDRVAVHFAAAEGVHASLTIAELRALVARICDGLAQAGVGSGDVVVSNLATGMERLIAYLACLARGAVWAQIPCDAKPDVIAGLIDGIGGRILFADASDPVLHSPQNVRETGLPANQALCVVAVGEIPPDLRHGPVHGWDSFGRPDAKLVFQRIAFNDPAVILFEYPLGAADVITHSAGGMLVTHLKEHRLHGDIKKGDILLGMNRDDPRLWLWQVSTIASGAAMSFVNGEGSCDLQTLQRIAENLQATHLVVDPATMAASGGHQAGVTDNPLPESVRALFFAGEMPDANLFDRIYTEISDDIMLCPMAGSSKFLANYFAGSPLHPVRRGEYSALALGMALHVLDDGGRPVVSRTGELVCSEAFPTMPKSTPFGDHGPASGGLPMGRLAQITCYGSGVLCPTREDGAAQPEEMPKQLDTKRIRCRACCASVNKSGEFNDRYRKRRLDWNNQWPARGRPVG